MGITPISNMKIIILLASVALLAAASSVSASPTKLGPYSITFDKRGEIGTPSYRSSVKVTTNGNVIYDKVGAVLSTYSTVANSLYEASDEGLYGFAYTLVEDGTDPSYIVIVVMTQAGRILEAQSAYTFDTTELDWNQGPLNLPQNLSDAERQAFEAIWSRSARALQPANE